MNKNKWFLNGGRESGKTFRLLWETYENKIAELEKENAELKEKLKPENCLKLLAKEGYIKFTSEQLTKAKELLERLLITSCNSDILNLLPNCSEVLSIRAEAEQFINEVYK